MGLATILIVGALIYIVYLGNKYLLDQKRRDEHIKWVKDQMAKCTDNDRYNELAKLLAKLLSQ